MKRQVRGTQRELNVMYGKNNHIGTGKRKSKNKASHPALSKTVVLTPNSPKWITFMNAAAADIRVPGEFCNLLGPWFY
ncbi:hypothetical protein e2017b09.tmp0031 [Eimeria tenella]|uniref:Uncharacterized protein n=1 Tax=Eimeria tenella TaxID=5802 RepID=C8TDV1_EIMTE|nr:hypothetical protein e2017b09.tmp0031 [Eimeria tenella]